MWAEPCLLAAAAKQLDGGLERWLAVAEQLFGPYLWGRSAFEHGSKALGSDEEWR